MMWDWDSPDTKYYLESIFARFLCHVMPLMRCRAPVTLCAAQGRTDSGLWLVSCSICPPLIDQSGCGPRTDLARCRVLTIKWAVMYKIWRRNGGTAPIFPKKQSQSMCTISLICWYNISLRFNFSMHSMEYISKKLLILKRLSCWIK